MCKKIITKTTIIYIVNKKTFHMKNKNENKKKTL